VRRISHLARTFDFRLPSNRWMMIAAGGAGLIVLVAGRDLGQAVGIGASSFLGWVVARELDPDRPAAANLVAVAAPVASWYFGGPSLLSVYLLAVAARVLVRSTGLPPKRGDVIFHVGLGVVAALGGIPALASIGLGVALLLDTRLPNPAPAAQAKWAYRLGVASVIVGLIRLPGFAWVAPALPAWMLVAAAMVAAVRVSPSPESVGDHTGERLLAIRARAGRWLTAGSATTLALAGGKVGVTAISPVLVALALSGWGQRQAPS
jgi:hypothetical protein